MISCTEHEPNLQFFNDNMTQQLWVKSNIKQQTCIWSDQITSGQV